MTSAGLKRPLDFDLSPHNASGSGSIACSAAHNVNKRRCTTNCTISPSIMANSNHNTNLIGGGMGHLNHHTQQHQNNQLPHQNHHHHHQANQHTLYVNSSSPFKNSSAILDSLSADVTSMLRSEAHRVHSHHHNNIANGAGSGNSTGHEPPVFTVRQTQLICEKLIKEREQKLREEYDKILISKLAEQYDTFVKYTHDHIEKRYNESNSHQASYLS